jgi:HAD superfamily hydrolase (TIGR01549 family)
MPATISDFTNLILPPDIRTIFLDLDNTCYVYEHCSLAARAAVATAITTIAGPLPDFQTRYEAAQAIVKARIPTHGSSHNRALYFQTLFEQLGRTDGHVHADTLERIYWEAFFTIMKPVAGLLDFLATCQQNDTTVVVVSDLTASIQCEKMRRLGIAHLVDYLVTSEEAGADKPNPIMFTLALEKASADARTTVMIGDSEPKDMSGAQSCGIHTILIRHEDLSHPSPL